MKILGAILLTDLAQGYGILDSQAALSISVFSFSVHTVSQTLSGLQLLCQKIYFFWDGLHVLDLFPFQILIISIKFRAWLDNSLN